jgi:mono/diheme cytochrome c family protein
MPNRIHVVFVAGLLAAASSGIAQTNTQIKQVPITPTSAASGKQMYNAYCATCHGLNGKGSGPAAVALKQQPTDLTVLTRNNGGKFPDAHIYAVLRFGVETPAHGSKEMPVWGPTLRSLSRGSNIAQMTEQQRIANLIGYLRSLQK